MILLDLNPLETVTKNGPYLGSAIICTGLFIWSQIQSYKAGKTVEDISKAISASNTELKNLLTTQAQAQTELAKSVNNLAEAMKGSTQMQHEQLDLIRDVMTEQKLQAQQMMTITNGFQKVVENLIDVVKDKD